MKTPQVGTKRATERKPEQEPESEPGNARGPGEQQAKRHRLTRWSWDDREEGLLKQLVAAAGNQKHQTFGMQEICTPITSIILSQIRDSH